MNPDLNPSNPWLYPGMYALPNQDPTEAEMAQAAELLARHEERMAWARMAMRGLFFAANIAGFAVAIRRGNSVPMAIGAGLVAPLYLTYVAVKQ